MSLIKCITSSKVSMIGTNERESMWLMKKKDIIIVAKENALTAKHSDIKLNTFIKDHITLKRMFGDARYDS